MAINVDALQDFTTARAHFEEKTAWVAVEVLAWAVQAAAAAVEAAVVPAAVQAEAVQEAARLVVAGVFEVHLLSQTPRQPIARLKLSASLVISVTTTSSTRGTASCAQAKVKQHSCVWRWAYQVLENKAASGRAKRMSIQVR